MSKKCNCGAIEQENNKILIEVVVPFDYKNKKEEYKLLIEDIIDRYASEEYFDHETMEGSE